MWTPSAPRVDQPWWQESTPSTQVHIKPKASQSTSQRILGLQSNVLVGAAPYALPTNIKVLPEYLNSLNYKSHAVGKWHLGSHTAGVTPTRRGFLSHTGYWTGHEDYFDHTAQELYGPVVSVPSFSFICSLLAMFRQCFQHQFHLPPAVRNKKKDSYFQPQGSSTTPLHLAHRTASLSTWKPYQTTSHNSTTKATM